MRDLNRREKMTLTKDALIEMIRDKVGYPVKEAKEILEIILEEVKLKFRDSVSGRSKKRDHDRVATHTQGRESKSRLVVS